MIFIKVNIYDFDRTIYNGDSSIDFYVFCLKKQFSLIRYLPIQLIFLFLFLLKIKTKKQFKEKYFSFLRGINDIDSLVGEFWKKNKKKIKNFYLSKNNNDDIIISASPEFLLKPICKELNVKDLIATNINKKTGVFKGENCYGIEKVIRYNKKYKGIIIDNFFTDSLSDIPLINISNNSFIVNNNNIIPFDKYKSNFIDKNKNKTLNFLLIVFSIMFFLFPLLTIYKENRKEFIILTILVLVLLLIIKKLKYIKNKKLILKINKKYIPLYIFSLCFISRLICVSIFNNSITQISDFNNALQRASDLTFAGNYYQVFSHWILYPKIVNIIFNIFGNSQLVALIFNSFILSFVPVFLYLIGKDIHSKKLGIIASMFYIFWPSMIFYTVIFTPDHVATLLILIIIYLYLKLYKKYNSINIKSILLSILIGIILSICTFFKNFSLVILVAIFIYLVLNFIILKKISLKKIIMFFIITLSFQFVKECLFCYCESLTSTKIMRSISPCYLNVGLNSRGNGGYNDELYNEYFQELKNNNYDYKKSNKIITNNLINDVKNNYRNLPLLLKNKSVVIFQDDTILLEWVKISTTNKNTALFIQKVSNYTNIYYVLASVCMVISLIKNYKFKNIDLYFIFIIIFGCSMMLMLVESQGRYKYAFLPLFALIVAFSFVGGEKNEKLH